MLSSNAIFAIIILILVVAGLSKVVSTVAKGSKNDILFEYK
ncbi:MAG: hypothetical protein QXK89_09795 [Candidatus Bathyarchaeia archaeon]